MKTLLAIILIIFLSSCISAQTKIGNITVSDSIANKYFADCYNHPDTVKEKKWDDYVSWINDDNKGNRHSNPITPDEDARINREVEEYNNNLARISIGKIGQYYIIPRKPSEQDFIKWQFKQAYK